MPLVLSEIRDSILLITLNSPPVNGLGLDLRQQIVDVISYAQNDPHILAIVITGSDKAF